MRCDHFLQLYFKREFLLFLIFHQTTSWEEISARSVIRPQSVVREKLSDGAQIWPSNATNYNFSKYFSSAKNNTFEIRDFQAELIPLPEPFQAVDVRFTAPPLHHLELITSALSQNKRKKIEENAKKNRKQSILLNRGIKKSDNDKQMFQKNSETIIDRDGSEFRSSAEFRSQNHQIFSTINHSKEEKQAFDKVNFQRPKSIGYQNSETKSAATDQLEAMSRENQQYEEQVKLLNSRKSIKPILSTSEAEGDSDFDLLTNLESDSPHMLTPKPSIWSDTSHPTNRISKHMEYGNQKQAEYLSLNQDCITGTAISNQPWNPLNTIAQSGKTWTPEYQISKMTNRSPASTPQHQLNYKQNPMSWDKISIFQGPIGQFVTPITPVNGIFDNSIYMNPSTLNSPWMSNREAIINRSWRTFNSIKTPASPIYKKYPETSLPALQTIRPPTAVSISQTNPSFNDFRLLLLPTTITTMKPNYQRTGIETDDYGNQQQQKDSRTRLEKYPTNLGMKTRETMDSVENRRSLIPVSESMILE
uniref:Uncharacterized protein n=1 Tax=Elaeophora elaphi TaxID=1147741 RepID=A0A0R3RUQ9_9BILA